MIVGIDLGTTTSEIAYIKNGKPELIAQYQSGIIPSVVGLNKNMDLVVGQAAKNQLVVARDRTAAHVKRKIGTNESILLAGKKFSPVELSTFILRELKKMGEEFLKEPITEAVITVPANFNDAQRQATKEAGEKAGFIVRRIINEPTAAALAFGIGHMETEGKILVYDLGGGTFDVTVLEMLEGSLDVLASRGINQLGGINFDAVLVEKIIQSFQYQHGINLTNNLRAMARIIHEAEQTKIALSSSNEVIVQLPYIAQKGNQPLSFEMKITRTEYENLIRSYLRETMDTVDDALKAANLTEKDIDLVIAVGGSSRIPLVREMLQKKFGNKLRDEVHPEAAVALGAAVQAGIEAKSFQGKESIAIFDICNHTLGTDVFNTRTRKLDYSRLILRDTHLPFAATRRYCTIADNQDLITVEIYQGESDDIDNNIKIGSLMVNEIPENAAGKENIDITFRYNVNGILEVDVIIVSTGKRASTKINMYEYDAPKESSVFSEENLPQPQYSLSAELRTTMMLYEKRKENLPKESQRLAEAMMSQLKEAINAGNAKRAEEIDRGLTDLLFAFKTEGCL